MSNAMYTVHTRHGWGWVVVGPAYQSYPIETAIAAQALADARNAGKQQTEALQAAGLEFCEGRLYEKGADHAKD